jgi:predicted aspartyl protease
MSRVPGRALVTLALAVLVGLTPGSAHAQIYRWVDDAGVPHYAEGLDSVPEHHRATATRLGLRNRPAAPPAAATDVSRSTPQRGATIRYTPGERILVDVRINGTASALLMLDTGADRTLISPRALAAAGASLTRSVGTGRLIGVTGDDHLPYVMIDSLEVGEARVGRMPVGAYEMAQMGGDGLLGRDFLDAFHVTIDAARGLVTLSPK